MSRFKGSIPVAAMAPLGLLVERGGLADPLPVAISATALACYVGASWIGPPEGGGRVFAARSLATLTRIQFGLLAALECAIALAAVLQWKLGAALVPLLIGIARGLWGRNGLVPLAEAIHKGR